MTHVIDPKHRELLVQSLLEYSMSGALASPLRLALETAADTITNQALEIAEHVKQKYAHDRSMEELFKQEHGH